MNSELNYLLSLLKVALNQQPAKIPNFEIDWNKLYLLAKTHSIANIVFEGIKQLPDNYKIEDNIYQKFKIAYSKAIAKEATQFYEGSKIFKSLNINRINYLPLKGWQLRNYYPHPALRSMSDIDFLVKDEDTLKIKDLMQELGYTVEHFQVGGHDVYMKVPYMNIEIHRELFTKTIDKNNYFNNIWNRLINIDNYQYKMTLEDTFIYMLAHMKKHYGNGGTGIRSVMDIWVYLDKEHNNLDWQYINTILKQEEMYEFTNEMINLAYTWFGDKDNEDTTIANYIVNSGTYGNMFHIYAKNLDDTNSSFASKKRKYFIQRIFPPLIFMKIRYPLLNKLPFLIVFCWLIRILALPFRTSKKNLCYEINSFKHLDENTIHMIKKADTLKNK